MAPEAVQPALPAPAVHSGGRFRVFQLLGLAILLLAGLAAYIWFFEQTHHSTPSQAPAPVEVTNDPVHDAIRRGVEYLKIHQEADGHFSKGLLDPKPAFTGLIVEALAKSPVPYTEADHAFLKKAAEAILTKQQPDGSICTPGFGFDVYTTSISILALSALKNPAYADAIAKAKDYLLRIQKPPEDASLEAGGVGYKAGGRVDGSNTAQWVEALKALGVEKDSEAFKNAEKFFTRLQNNPETNPVPAEGTEIGNDGGFFYRPGESKVYDTSRGGKKVPKSYGLMSYAGLKSFLYMDVAKDDPRVQSAWRWVNENFTLEENRNIGPNGLFYYYLTMAKALAAYGEPVVETPDGVKHEWAKELAEKLLSMQKLDGSWRNDASDKWFENDSVMVTAFAIRTLAICREFQRARVAPKGP